MRYPLEERRLVARAELRRNMELHQMTMGTLAKRLNMTRQTLSRRMREPENLTVDELRLTSKALELSDSQILRIVKGG